MNPLYLLYPVPQGHAGSGSVVAGYKRTLSPLDSLEVNAVLGLRSLLTVTSNRQLGTYTTGSLSATYSYGQGVGMQVRVRYWVGRGEGGSSGGAVAVGGDGDGGVMVGWHSAAVAIVPIHGLSWVVVWLACLTGMHKCLVFLTLPLQLPFPLPLQATTSRQVTANTSASLTWVIGPSPGTAMVFSMSHKGSSYVITGRLDLGLVTSLSSRFVYQLSEDYR